MSLLVDIEKDYGGFHLCSRFETNGGITGLLGASGCGKSQTLRCIAGVQTPDQGRIVLDGVTLYDSERHINLTPQQRGVGYLFQSYALFPNMTVRANILTGLRREKDAAKKQAAFEHAIHLLKLEGLEDRRPAQLSGGQAQRVALARMLVSRPKALLLDEPSSTIRAGWRSTPQSGTKMVWSSTLRAGKMFLQPVRRPPCTVRGSANTCLVGPWASTRPASITAICPHMW